MFGFFKRIFSSVNSQGRQPALAALGQLNAAPIFLDVYRRTTLPENLDIYLQPPDKICANPKADAAITQGRLIPLLDDGQSKWILFFDPVTHELWHIDIEAESAPRVRYANWSQYLGNLLVWIGQTINDPDRLQRISTLVGFTYWDQLKKYLEDNPDPIGDWSDFGPSLTTD